jgi:hypothetical protein
MKYINRFLLTIILVTAGCGGTLFASEFSRSVSFTRTQGRAAAVGSFDTVYYNPAGMTGLKDGLYIDAGYQIMTKTTAIEVWHNNSEDNTPSWFIPNFAMAYKKGKGAVFISLCMPEGIEFLDYRDPQGMAGAGYLGLNLDPLQMGVLRSYGLTVNAGPYELPLINYVKASKYWLQGRLGGSFSIGDVVAFSGGIACNYFQAERSAGIINAGTIDKIERQALGWSGFAGVMVGKLDTFVLMALYETEVIARGTEKNVKYNYTRIIEQRYPDSLLIGFNLKSGDGGSLQFSYQIAFTGERNYGTKNILTTSHEFGYLDWALIAQNASAWAVLPLINNGNAQNYKYKNRHSFGVTLEFNIQGVITSAGISYTTQEKYPRVQNPLDPDLARAGVGAGVKINASNVVTIDTGTAYYYYITDRMLYNSVKMNKMAWTWGISTTFKAM